MNNRKLCIENILSNLHEWLLNPKYRTTYIENWVVATHIEYIHIENIEPPNHIDYTFCSHKVRFRIYNLTCLHVAQLCYPLQRTFSPLCASNVLAALQKIPEQYIYHWHHLSQGLPCDDTQSYPWWNSKQWKKTRK